MNKQHQDKSMYEKADMPEITYSFRSDQRQQKLRTVQKESAFDEN